MWLFTRHGFYSLTRSSDEPDKLQVRARVRRDLENLRSVAGLTGPVLETPNADYCWRKGVFGGTDRANGSEKLGSAKADVSEVGDRPIPARPTPAQPRFSISQRALARA